MQIEFEKILENYASILAIMMVDEEEGIKEFDALKKILENYKIVPKEEWGVIYNSNDSGKYVTRGFSSENEAKRFKDEWYEKQEEYIESILTTNPESNVRSCETYLTVGKISEIKDEYRWFKYDHELNKDEKC